MGEGGEGAEVHSNKKKQNRDRTRLDFCSLGEYELYIKLMKLELTWTHRLTALENRQAV